MCRSQDIMIVVICTWKMVVRRGRREGEGKVRSGKLANFRKLTAVVFF